MNKKETLKKIGIGVGCVVLFAAGCYVGKKMFIQRLIRTEWNGLENGTKAWEMNWPVYNSMNKKKHGGMIFEIKAECVGD